jgi:hypothetical protein
MAIQEAFHFAVPGSALDLACTAPELGAIGTTAVPTEIRGTARPAAEATASAS